MSWRIAIDPNPENPNPHPWDLGRPAYSSHGDAEFFAQKEWDELAQEYGDDYANENYRWLIVEDKLVEPNLPALPA